MKRALRMFVIFGLIALPFWGIGASKTANDIRVQEGEIYYDDRAEELVTNFVISSKDKVGLSNVKLLDENNSEILFNKPFDCSTSIGVESETSFVSCKTKMHKILLKEIDKDFKSISLKASTQSQPYVMLPTVIDPSRPQSLANGGPMVFLDEQYRQPNYIVLSETPLGSATSTDTKPRLTDQPIDQSKRPQANSNVLDDGAGACDLKYGEESGRAQDFALMIFLGLGILLRGRIKRLR